MDTIVIVSVLFLSTTDLPHSLKMVHRLLDILTQSRWHTHLPMYHTNAITDNR